MRTRIVRNLILAMSLGIAPVGLAAAQDYELKKPLKGGEATEQPQQKGEAVAPRPEGEAGAEGEGGTAVAPRPEGEGGTEGEAAQVPRPENEAQPEGEAAMPPAEDGSTAERPAQDDDGGTAEAPAKEGETGGTTAEEAPAGEKTDDTAADTEAPDTETTGSIDITVEQKTEITKVIRETAPEPVDVDIDVSIGTTVPETVTLHPLPPRIVEIVPSYEGYLFFILPDGTIVIVAADTREIVYVIVA